MKNRAIYFFLYLILAFAFAIRVFGINWDLGYHLHPDERAIILSVVTLHFPQTIGEFFSVESPWNTKFFAYGSFPFYLLFLTSQLAGGLDPKLTTYDGIQFVGRLLSAVADLGTIALLFFLGRKLKTATVGLAAAGLYAISVLPIQLSHFFAVDTLLTFLTLLTIFLLIRFYEHPNLLRAALVGIALGFALATKISASLLLVAIGITLVVDFALLVAAKPHKPHLWLLHAPKFLMKLVKDVLVIFLATVVVYAVLSPYTFIDAQRFLQQTTEQQRMTQSAFTFPYTLQYVGKIPYVYELKNMFFYGFGPFLGATAFLGFLYFCIVTARTKTKEAFAKHLLLLVFFVVYFAIVGRFAIGFMRYMLPLYPLFCLFAAMLLVFLYAAVADISKILARVLMALLAVGILVWPVSFLTIYAHEPTRVSATKWIHANITEGSTLALEHWDDALPLSGIEKYTIETLPLYEPDSPFKWEQINSSLAKADYIVLASNRLYTPLQQMTNCSVLPPERCYAKTALYYERLFNGDLGFSKDMTFAVYPTIPFFNVLLNDQHADESFTVYDHPKVIIFKKTATFNPL